MIKQIDNIFTIQNLLNFPKDKSLYAFITIYQRKKDNPEIKEQMNAIKHYYIDSFKSLQKHYDEIKTLCNTFNARAYISYGLRNRSTIMQTLFANMSNMMQNFNDVNIENIAYISSNSVRQNRPSRKNSYYLVDCDFTDIDENHKVDEMLRECGATTIVINYTPNGYHHLAKGVDTRKFVKLIETCNLEHASDIELKGYDAYTLLYCSLNTDKIKKL